MQFFVLTALVAIFERSEADKPRSINVALDTVLEFEKSSDVDFINKIQGFLSKVKDIIQDNPNQREPTRRARRYKFTDFLVDVINTLNGFTDRDLKDVVEVIDQEVRKNVLKKNIRRFISSKLGRIKSTRKIRNNLNDILKKLQYGKKSKERHFLGFINSLYKKDSEEKLAKFIRQLKIFRRSSYKKRKDLQGTVRKAVQLIVFDHISNLSDNIKREAETRINEYLGNYFPSKSDMRSRVYEESDYEIQPSEEVFLQKSQEKEIAVTKRNKKVDVVKTHLPGNAKTFTKVRKSHNKRIKTLKHPKKKLTHVTLYPESLELGDKELRTHFRATRPFAHLKVISTNTDKSLEDAISITSLSHSTEINVNFKDNKIHKEKFDRNSYSPVKARTFRTKARKSRKNIYIEQHPAYITIKRMKYLPNPKTSVEIFGNLYNKNRKPDEKYGSKELDISETEKIVQKATETLPRNNNAVTDNVTNNTKSYKLITDNKFNKNPKINTVKTEEYLKKEGYRRANGIIDIEKATTKLTFKDMSSKITTSKVTTKYYVSNITAKFESTTDKMLSLENNTTSDQVSKFANKINENFSNDISTNEIFPIPKGNITQNHTKLQTESSKEPDKNAKFTLATNDDNLYNKVVSDTAIVETRTTNQSFPLTFDLRKYLKNSEVNDIADIEKRKEIERKMEEDMDNLLAIPTTNATTTQAYTDIFEALDDAFGLPPIK